MPSTQAAVFAGRPAGYRLDLPLEGAVNRSAIDLFEEHRTILARTEIPGPVPKRAADRRLPRLRH